MKIMITLTVANLLISSATLAIVVVAGKHAYLKVEETRANANQSLARMKRAINSIGEF